MHSRINNDRPEKVTYLGEIEVLVIHAKIIDASAHGSHGIRDIELLRSALDRPKMTAFGKDLYPDIFTKAAAYFHSIIFNHAFIDGNKRSAFSLAARFLYINGFEFNASNKEVVEYVVTSVIEHHSVETIAEWLRKWSKEI